MQNLVIRFIRTKGFVSRAICFVTFSYCDHVEAKNRTGDAWVGAHAGTGIGALPLDWADKDLLWSREYSISCTDEEYERAMSFQEAAIGTKYNYLGCLGVLLRRRKLNNPNRKDCSEHVFELLNETFQLPPMNVLPAFSWAITPEMLHTASLFIGKCSLFFSKSKYTVIK
jgi:hypothetical protein